jgi:hypothetical protein
MTGPNVDIGGEAEGLAADRAATQDSARRMAAIIAEQMKAGNTAEKQGVINVDATAEDAGQVQQTQTEGEAAGAAESAATEQTEEATVDISGLEALLKEADIDLGIAPSDVPVELQGVYMKLVEQAADLAQTSKAHQVEAAEANARIRDFAEKLEKQPDRVLLTMALNNPEIFSKVIETFQAMQQDEGIKNLVIRELQVEARLQEAERKESAVKEVDVRNKAQKVISATRKAARQYGVDVTAAEQIVALAVKANGGDLDASKVGELVSQLRAGPRKVAPKVVTPAKQAAVKQAPTQESGAAAPPVNQDGSKGLKISQGPHGRLRGLIDAAISRVRPGQQ